MNGPFRSGKISLARRFAIYPTTLPVTRSRGYILSGVEEDGKGANMKISNAELLKIGNIKINGNVRPQPSIPTFIGVPRMGEDRLHQQRTPG